MRITKCTMDFEKRTAEQNIQLVELIVEKSNEKTCFLIFNRNSYLCRNL